MSLALSDFGSIPSNPARSTIVGYFASGITFTNDSLKEMYGLFTTGSKTTGAGFSRDFFGGKGRIWWNQTAVTSSTTAKDTTKIDITIEVFNESQGYESKFRVAYHEDDGQIPFSGQTVTRTAWAEDSGGFFQETLSGLNTSTQYWIKVEGYNGFGTQSNYFTGGNESETTPAPRTWDAPDVTSSSANLSEMSADWNQYDQFGGLQPNSYELRFRINGGSWNTGSLDTNSNWNTSTNPKSGTWFYSGQLPNSGDTVDFQIRASEDTDAYASAWSTTQTYTV